MDMQEDEAWLHYRRVFADIYDYANYTSPLQAWVMRASHRLTERPLKADDHFEKVIEIGAGTGEHFAHVRHRYGSYLLTDMDERALEVARKKVIVPKGSTVSYEVSDGTVAKYADNSFDRLIATHVLEHIYQPHLALKEWRRIVKPGGMISILIPTDPGMAWRFCRHLGPRRTYTRLGIAYDYMMAREHVNACNNLIALMRHYFPQRLERWWPTPVPSMDINLFFLFQARNDKA
ncbi:MAG: SAM-dependent methyltransferase [Moraxellaceae bacterium]|jgi:ubiquinone/menaquinone biosynthesis C-methylase UbiE|nr:SAM-dependent methyltransferase [Moraxellaceae bacterium]